MSEYLIFDSIDTRSYNVHLFNVNNYDAPAREYNTVKIPGKNGYLLIDTKRFENMQHIYYGIIYDNFETNIVNLRNALKSKINYKELSDSIHSDEYYLATFIEALEVESTINRNMGKFKLIFNRKPQRFLNSGKTVSSYTLSGSSISNPTLFDSKPLIKVTGYGTLTIRSDVITIASGQTYVCIDSETMDCYTGTTNKNSKVTFQSNNFPVLIPGSNNITWSGNITKVEITPRWWRI